MAELKACRDCGSVGPADAFPRYSGGRGFKPICSVCVRVKDAGYKATRRANDPAYYTLEIERNKAYRDRYSDGYRAHQLRKRKKQKSRYHSDTLSRMTSICGSALKRAERKGLPFTITPNHLMGFLLIQDYKCAVTGTILDLSPSSEYHKNPYAPSLDRKNNDKGYTLDNIQIVCVWYNIMKNEWSDDEVRNFISTAYFAMFGSN